MMRLLIKTFSSCLVVGMAGCSSAGAPEAPPAPDAGPVQVAAPAPAAPTPGPAASAATFSDAQADAGRNTFRATCTECHYSSEFSDSQFKFKWSRRNAGNLYQFISTTMPETAPGSLTDEESVALVSYILRMNGFAPGASELPADRAVLDGISLSSIRND